jgi:hypothetical protein
VKKRKKIKKRSMFNLIFQFEEEEEEEEEESIKDLCSI